MESTFSFFFNVLLELYSAVFVLGRSHDFAAFTEAPDTAQLQLHQLQLGLHLPTMPQCNIEINQQIWALFVRSSGTRIHYGTLSRQEA